MNILVTGKQLDVGEALRQYVEETIGTTVEKYFSNAIESKIAISKDKKGFVADVSVHAMSGVVIQGSGSGNDAHAALDSANDRIAKQLRRYKNRLKDHKGNGSVVEVPAYVLSPETFDSEELPEEEAAPIVVAEMTADIPTCSVSGAVMRMDLANANAFMFRNSSHGGLNMVYRREDGNIGWVDPKDK